MPDGEEYFKLSSVSVFYQSSGESAAAGVATRFLLYVSGSIVITGIMIYSIIILEKLLGRRYTGAQIIKIKR